MKTKLMLTAAAIIFTGATAFAQSKTTFGINAGVNFYNINGKDEDGDKENGKLKTGFNAGVNAEIPVGIDFFVQPGVSFFVKGAKDINGTDSKINIGYVEIPVNFLYKPELGTGKLLLGFGPYAAFGVTGKVKYPGGDADIKFKSDVTTAELITGAAAYVKRFDAGANLLFGYQFANNLSVQLDASLGLTDINPKVDGSTAGESSAKNTGFGVSLGYRF